MASIPNPFVISPGNTDPLRRQTYYQGAPIQQAAMVPAGQVQPMAAQEVQPLLARVLQPIPPAAGVQDFGAGMTAEAIPPEEVEANKGAWAKIFMGLKNNPEAIQALLTAAAVMIQPVDPMKGESPVQRIIEGVMAGHGDWIRARAGARAEEREEEKLKMERERVEDTKRRTGIAEESQEMQAAQLLLQIEQAEREGASRLLSDRARELQIEKLEREGSPEAIARDRRREDLQLEAASLARKTAQMNAELAQERLRLARSKLEQDPEMLLMQIAMDRASAEVEEGVAPSDEDLLRKLAEVKSEFSAKTYQEFRDQFIQSTLAGLVAASAEAGEFDILRIKSSINETLSDSFIRSLYTKLGFGKPEGAPEPEAAAPSPETSGKVGGRAPGKVIKLDESDLL